MKLRPYQQRAIDQLYDWFRAGNTGNPCLVLPTGAGKSHIVAALCYDALTQWPETRVLMLTHVKELIEQNAAKLRAHWPGAPMGIYSASVGRKELGEPITFAGIQSIRKRAAELGHVDLVIIDECFVAGTPIKTMRGEVHIDKVKCGDIVLSQAGAAVVEATSCRPCFETFVVEFDNGTSVECTENHPFFTEEGWKKAGELEVGARLFSVEDVSSLWERVSSVDQNRRHDALHGGAGLDQAAVLLGIVCEEMRAYRAIRSGTKQDEGSAEGDSTQAYQAWRKRAVASFTAARNASRPRRRMGSGARNQNECWAPERSVSELLQGRHRERGTKDSDRTGWRISQRTESCGRQEENRFLGSVGVVSVSRVKRESPVAVFNLRVGGHPSYFAGGVAVHNCHLVSHRDEGGYRTFLADLQCVNPALRVIGLTATPYRLGHGYIDEDGGLFSDRIEPVSIEELVQLGYLSRLRSKVTGARLDTTGVHTRGGEFVEAELQRAVNTRDQNERVVREVIGLAGDRRSWLFFCAGVEHAEAVCEALRSQGVNSDFVTGLTPKKERERIISDFKAGRLQALTNANVLTTGFDHPGVDLIAMLRPTMSPGLYVQMAGRGLRIAEGKADCLVLDFAGVVERHGPITAVEPPGRRREGTGEAPVKVCDACAELVHPTCRVCPSCGFEFPLPEPKKLELRDVDIMGPPPSTMRELIVTEWEWRRHVGRASGKESLRVRYYGGLTESVDEYLTIAHDGYPGDKARRTLARIASDAGASPGVSLAYDLDEIARTMNAAQPPSVVRYTQTGKFAEVLKREWADVRREEVA